MLTVAPLHTMLDRMATFSRVIDQAVGAQPANGEFWTPSLDAHETEHAYVVSIDLPGIDPSKVDVNFERNTLTVKGTRDTLVEKKEASRVVFTERESGSFERSLRFPFHVEGDKIAAQFTNGVLTVTVPKAEASKARKITVAGQHA